MSEIVGIRFKDTGKVYYFDPDGETFEKGNYAIVETVRGVECGEVVIENKSVPDEEIVKPLKKIVRPANRQDIKTYNENNRKEKEAMETCRKRIEFHKLEMNLVDVEYTFDRGKIIFYFTADGRVDFRELVKDLAGIFRTRIELRQIGVRDEAKMLGGLGICGRPFCCKSFLGNFQPVSIKMAKEQGLSLNPGKISGTCGRLMCCLKYEQDTYEHLLKNTPKPGAIVETADGRGKVVEISLLTGKLKVVHDDNQMGIPKTYDVKDVKLLKDARISVNKEELEALKSIEE
ncbi:MAG: stage 0 sporulation family protein [Clostridia bacterium]|jgi:cell fate regulator YaaT (PSP1 superfamily)|nr:stage 0 sporulation family protein [Clostridia bacterium]